MNKSFWEGKKVFLTGHTGFKGGWTSLWLSSLGAKVSGYSLTPPSNPNLFSAASVEDHLVGHVIGDIRDAELLSKSMQDANPDIVLHMAAQALVRPSYDDPIETYSVNVIGTAQVFEAVRKVDNIKAIVNVTTDKCYENREWVWPYREDEAMGGFDPYSSSKGCSELVTSAYRRSFFEKNGVQLASARAGNVIGGGDWAIDRLIPDFIRTLDSEDQKLIIRSPNAIRPWQHVLEPISGYLSLAEALYNEQDEVAEGWNFGPNEEDAKSVSWICDYLCSKYPKSSWEIDKAPQLHEANVLKLDISKARSKLNWHPRWNLAQALDMTLEWNAAWYENNDMSAKSMQQIEVYEAS